MEVVLLVKAQSGGLVGVVQEDLEVGFIETVVAPTRYRGFDYCHTAVVTQEVRALNGSGVNTLVAQLGKEAAIAVVDGIGDAAEVGNKVVGGTSVDMVDGHACGYLFVAPGDIDGMRG